MSGSRGTSSRDILGVSDKDRSDIKRANRRKRLVLWMAAWILPAISFISSYLWFSSSDSGGSDAGIYPFAQATQLVMFRGSPYKAGAVLVVALSVVAFVAGAVIAGLSNDLQEDTAIRYNVFSPGDR